MKALLGGMIVAAFVFIACSAGDVPCNRDEDSYQHFIKVEGYEIAGAWELFTDEILVRGEDSLTLNSACLQQQIDSGPGPTYHSDWLASITFDLADENLDVTIIR